VKRRGYIKKGTSRSVGIAISSSSFYQGRTFERRRNEKVILYWENYGKSKRWLNEMKRSEMGFVLIAIGLKSRFKNLKAYTQSLLVYLLKSVPTVRAS